MMDESAVASPPEAASIRFYLPAPALRPLITSYYLIDSPGPLSEWLHPEWGNIRFSLRGEWQVASMGGHAEAPRRSSLFGPTDRTRRFGTDGGAMIGIGLTPLGWLRIVRRDAGGLANRFAALDDTLGMPGDALAVDLARCADDAARCAMLDTLFAGSGERAHADEAATMGVQRILIAGMADTVEEFVAATGLSHRTLNRLCLRVFGFGPKRLLRRQRFLRTLARIRDRLDQPLAALLDDDYYDQAHFIREFRAFMGMAPTAYFASPREVMRRIATERARVIGAPVQGLHGS